MKNIIIILISLILTFNYSYGSAILAGDLTMESLSPIHYKTTLTLFNDCAGTSAPDSVLVFYQCLSQSSLNFSQYVIAIPYTGYEIINLHDTSITTCNGGTALGYRKHTYENLVQLDSTQDWKIYINIQGRGSSNSCFTNSNQGFYMECILNLSLGTNSSPSYLTDNAAIDIPTLYPYCSSGYNDNDGDSLSYKLISPLLDSTNQINYNYPFDANNFLPSFSPITIDSINGIICFNASTDFIGITKLQITEWREINNQKVKIGVSQRDLMFHSYIVYNHPPVLSGMDFNLTNQYNPLDTIYSKEFFIGDSIHFRIHAHDIDSGLNSNCSNAHQLKVHINYYNLDSVFFSADINTFNNLTDSAYLDFYWIPDSNDISSTAYYLGINVKDHWAYLQASGRNTFYYKILISQPLAAISDNTKDDKLVLYPNPTNDFLRIQLKKIYPEIKLNLFDITGRYIKAEVHRNQKEIKIDLSDLSKGSYLISIETEDNYFTEKIVKE